MALPTPQELDMLESQEEYSPPINRQKCSFTDKSERFVLSHKNFNQQYAETYSRRFRELKPVVLQRARREWNENGCFLQMRLILKGKYEVLEKLLDINQGERSCIIVGTLFKEMPLVSRLLSEFNEVF